MKWISEKKLSIIKRVAIIFVWVVLSAGLLFTVFYFNTQENNTKAIRLIVQIMPENLEFFNRKKVIETIRTDGDESSIIGLNINDINTTRLETKLTKNKQLSEARVYNDLMGNIYIKVKQREPILRLYRYNGVNYYVDKYGVKFGLSTSFAAHVPIANGNVFERFNPGDTVYSFVAKELYKIATYVDKKPFWKAQIEQIFVTRDNEFILIPKVGNHQIIFGDAQELEVKFEKLFVFYKEGLNRVGWNKYKSIDVRFDDQIVCK